MTIKWLIKILKSRVFRISIFVLSAVFIIVLAVKNKPANVLAQNNPEKSITDASGQPRATFAVGEDGVLTLKGYAKDLPISYKPADIMLVIDTSGSMNTVVGTKSKCQQVRNAAKAFINDIDTTRQTKVGVELITVNAPPPEFQLTLMDAAGKTSINSFIQSITCVGTTPTGDAAERANIEFASVRHRSDAEKSMIILSDGGETVGTPLNGEWFQAPQASDPNYQYKPASPIANSISEDVKYFTIFYGDNTQTCTNQGDPGALSYGCSLMRYGAAKTNKVSLPAGFNWMSDYKFEDLSGGTNGVDGVSFFKVASESELADIYENIISYMQQTNAKMVFYEKLNPGVKFNKLSSTRDKANRYYSATFEVLPDNTYKFSFPKIPQTYNCKVGETDCLNAATNGIINNNFINLKLNVTFNQKGKFDLDSNYSGCESGVLNKAGEWSKIDYIDPRDNSVNQTLGMPALCLNVVDSGVGLSISKTTYKEDKTVSPSKLVEQASFVAGDEVIVKIVINEALPSRAIWKIEDQIPPSVTKLIGDATLTTPISPNPVTLQSDLSSGKVTFQNDGSNTSANLLAGANVIQYKYNF